MNTTVLEHTRAYFSTIAQPFPIFRKLLPIIPTIQKSSTLKNSEFKNNTNTKSLIMLTELVL